jgi:adenine-specific DNA-methyltransferase
MPSLLGQKILYLPILFFIYFHYSILAFLSQCEHPLVNSEEDKTNHYPADSEEEKTNHYSLPTNHYQLATNHYPDIGFRVFKVDTTNMKDVYYGAREYKQEDLDSLVSNIKDDRTDIDLLYGCILDWRLELSYTHTTETIDGFTVHIVNDDPAGATLIACFNTGISEKAITAIAKKKPLRAVFRDSSFASSPEKINVFEIFKLHAPDTKVKVI